MITPSFISKYTGATQNNNVAAKASGSVTSLITYFQCDFTWDIAEDRGNP